ncbi:MAG: PAS domain S-box protein [Candidatus Aminicenantes bacterium]|jgi:PAS domain S-box-containing protein
MKDEEKTKEQLVSEIHELRKKIYELEIFKITRESVQKVLIDNEAKLIESERRYRMIFDKTNDGIVIHEPEGKILDVNKNMYTRLGYTREEMLKMKLSDLVSQEFSGKIRGRTRELEDEGVAVFESGDIRKDGTVMPVEVSARSIDYRGQKAILSVVRDITQRKMAEDLIMNTLSEKEILLEEIQNQLKRNMQMFTHMLEHRLKAAKDEQTEGAFRTLMERVKSYSYIYEKIYRYRNYTKIDFSDFIKWETTILFSQEKSGIENVRLKRDSDDVFLDIQRAIPCGLIIQELVSNALKHAFPKGKKGEISLSMRLLKANKYKLIIRDNGIGLPEELDFSRAKALGFRLVKEYVEQIKGTIKLDTSKGTQFTISF